MFWYPWEFPLIHGTLWPPWERALAIGCTSWSHNTPLKYTIKLMCASNFIRSQYNTIYYSKVRSEYYIHTRTLHCMYMSKVFFLPQRLHSLHLYIQDMADKCYNHLQTTLFRRYISRECLSNHMIKMYTVHILRYRVNEL